ncbi:hypothetical protein DPMN_148425 [Dreissena polymorpha]|uniref:Uncharacterized protein n=1 Tax=Dreissena polymorpha TaxID=45954 RepID=A0A9D4J4C1_DREPO|nr:hypothetical protein DPMN_148425 [Dreissena polymorpha]
MLPIVSVYSTSEALKCPKRSGTWSFKPDAEATNTPCPAINPPPAGQSDAKELSGVLDDLTVLTTQLVTCLKDQLIVNNENAKLLQQLEFYFFILAT